MSRVFQEQPNDAVLQITRSLRLWSGWILPLARTVVLDDISEVREIMDAKTYAAFVEHVRMLEVAAGAGDLTASKSLACMALSREHKAMLRRKKQHLYDARVLSRLHDRDKPEKDDTPKRVSLPRGATLPADGQCEPKTGGEITDGA
jgi:hypothetical protein